MQIGTKETQFYLISAYVPPAENTQTNFEEAINQIRTVIQTVNQLGNVILGFDSYSKSRLWGSPIEDPRGRKFSKMIEDTELVLLKEGDTPTFDGPRGTSFIDITAVNLGAFKNTTDWSIPDIISMSDHRWIEFSINTTTHTTTDTDGFCNKRADWAQFRESFLNGFQSVRNQIKNATTPEDVENDVT